MEPLEPLLSFRTLRLLVRPVADSDALAIFEGYARDPQVTRYLLWTPHQSLADTRSFLARCAAGWRSGEILSWALCPAPADGCAAEPLAGMLACQLAPPEVHVGYVLARRWWRQGLATEAVTALAERVLALPGIERLTAYCHADHEASARVLLRAGFRERGLLTAHIVFPNLGSQACDCRDFVREG